MVLTRRRSENPSLTFGFLKIPSLCLQSFIFFPIFTWTGTKLPPTKVLAEIREEELTLLWGLNMQFAGLWLQRRWKWQSSGSFVRFIPQLGREKGGAILLELKIRCFECNRAAFTLNYFKKDCVDAKLIFFNSEWSWCKSRLFTLFWTLFFKWKDKLHKGQRWKVTGQTSFCRKFSKWRFWVGDAIKIWASCWFIAQLYYEGRMACLRKRECSALNKMTCFF